MPISIPTSIDGISVPGSLVTGPLAELYGNKENIALLKYPRNLDNDATRKHVVEFTIMVPDPSSKDSTAAVSEVVSTGVELAGAIQDAAVAGLGSAFGGPGNDKEVKQMAEKTNALGRSLGTFIKKDVDRKIKTVINLYMPDTMNASYSAVWGEGDIDNALGKAGFAAQAGASIIDAYKKGEGIKDIANRIGNDPYVRKTAGAAFNKLAGGEGLNDLLLRSIGQAFNPQLQVLFKGIGFRTFQFDFVFTPYSLEESKQIRKIVQEFKLAMSPEIDRNGIIYGEGMFFTVPDVIHIKFMYNGRQNENVHRIAPCVLDNMNIDYAPMGWSTFSDGQPVQTRMTLNFKEIELIDKARIREGF